MPYKTIIESMIEYIQSQIERVDQIQSQIERVDQIQSQIERVDQIHTISYKTMIEYIQS
jgi:hypothetical protein